MLVVYAVGCGVNPEPRVLYALLSPGSTHDHMLSVVSVAFPDGSEEPYLEVSEPRGCTCQRRIALSEAVHLLLNATGTELLTIPNRDADEQGHSHLVARGGVA